MTTRDEPPSLWTITGIIGAAVLSAAGAAIVGFNTFLMTQVWQQAEEIAALEKMVEAVEKEGQRPAPDVTTARVEVDALRSDIAELTKRIDEIEQKTDHR